MNKEYLKLFESLVLKKKEETKNFKTSRKSPIFV